MCNKSIFWLLAFSTACTEITLSENHPGGCPQYALLPPKSRIQMYAVQHILVNSADKDVQSLEARLTSQELPVPRGTDKSGYVPA